MQTKTVFFSPSILRSLRSVWRDMSHHTRHHMKADAMGQEKVRNCAYPEIRYVGSRVCVCVTISDIQTSDAQRRKKILRLIVSVITVMLYSWRLTQ